MVDRLKAAYRQLRADERRVLIAASALLVTLLLPWYTKVTTTASIDFSNGFPSTSPDSVRDQKLAIFVPSLIEASIMLVAVGVIVLMLARGLGAKFFLPLSDRVLVIAAGGWLLLLVFWRLVDQPSAQSATGLTVEYELSWGIYFGLLAAAAVLASGLTLHRPEPEPEPDAP